MGSTWSYIVDVYDDLVQMITDITNDITDGIEDMWDDLISGDIAGLINDIGQLAEDLVVDIVVDSAGVVTDITKVVESAFEDFLYAAELALNEFLFGNCDMKTPWAANTCTLSNDEIVKVKDLCSFFDDGNSMCRKYCDMMGVEWEYHDRQGDCLYNICDNKSTMDGSGCCGICCPYAGSGCRCKRKSSLGDPLSCCFRDLKCHVSDINDANEIAFNPYCFETAEETKTCSTFYRDQGGSSCRDRLEDYCLGLDLSDNSREFYDRWVADVEYNGVVYNKPCQRTLYRNVYANNTDVDKMVCNITNYDNTNNMETVINNLNTYYVPDPNGLEWGRNLINNLMGRYINLGGTLSGREDSEGDTRMNDMFFNICNETPGLCSNMLSNYCVNVTNDSLERDSSLLPFCGCYMPPEQYSKYSSYQIQRQCTPTCNATGVIPIVGSDNFTPQTCSQSFCIIDDVSISIINSSNSDVTFSQLCGSCSEGNAICNCTISGFTLNEIDSTLGNTTISQNCGTSKCYAEIYDNQGNLTTVEVPCNGSTDDVEPPEDNDSSSNNSLNTALFIGFFILILIIVVIWNIVLSNS